VLRRAPSGSRCPATCPRARTGSGSQILGRDALCQFRVLLGPLASHRQRVFEHLRCGRRRHERARDACARRLGGGHREVAAQGARPQQHPPQRPRRHTVGLKFTDGVQEGQDVGVLLGDAYDGRGHPVHQRGAHHMAFSTHRPQLLRQGVQDVHALQPQPGANKAT
jgi:hypothetical protein